MSHLSFKGDWWSSKWSRVLLEQVGQVGVLVEIVSEEVISRGAQGLQIADEAVGEKLFILIPTTTTGSGRCLLMETTLDELQGVQERRRLAGLEPQQVALSKQAFVATVTKRTGHRLRLLVIFRPRRRSYRCLELDRSGGLSRHGRIATTTTTTTAG